MTSIFDDQTQSTHVTVPNSSPNDDQKTLHILDSAHNTNYYQDTNLQNQNPINTSPIKIHAKQLGHTLNHLQSVESANAQLKFKLIETSKILEKFKTKAQETITNLRNELRAKNDLLFREQKFSQELQTSSNNNLTNSLNEIKSLKVTVKNLQETKSNLSSRCETLTQSNSHLKFTLKSNEQEIQYLREISNGFRVKITELEENLAEKSQVIEKLENQISAETTKLPTEPQKSQTTTEPNVTNKTNKDEILTLKSQISTLESRNSELLAKLKTQIIANDNLKSDSSAKEKSFIKMQSSSNGYKVRFENLTSKLANSEKNNQILDEANKKLMNENNLAKEKIENLTRVTDNFRSKFELLEKKMSAKEKIIFDCKHILKVLEVEGSLPEFCSLGIAGQSLGLLENITENFEKTDVNPDNITDNDFFRIFETIINTYTSTKTTAAKTKEANSNLQIELEKAKLQNDEKTYDLQKLAITSRQKINSITAENQDKYELIIKNLKDSHKKSMTALELVNAELEDKLSEANEKVTNAENYKIPNVEKKLKIIKHENLALTQLISEKELEIKQMAKNLKNQENSSANYKETLIQTEEKYENLIKNLNGQISEKNENNLVLRNQVEENIQKLEDLKISERKQANEFKFDLMTLQQELNNISEKSAKNEKDLSRAKVENKELVTKINALELETTKLREENQNLSKNTENQKANNKNLENRLKKAESYKSLFENLEKTSQEKENSLIKLATAENLKLKSSLKNHKMADVNSKKEIDGLRVKIDKMTETIRELTNNLKNEENKSNLLNKALASAREQLLNFKNVKIPELENSLNFHQKKAKELELENLAQSTKIQLQSKNLSKEKSRILREKNEIATISALKSKITSIQSNADENNLTNQSTIKKLKAEISCLKSTNQRIKNLIDTKDLENDRIKAKLEVANTKWECQKKELTYKNGSDQMMTDKINQLQGKIVELEGQLAESLLKNQQNERFLREFRIDEQGDANKELALNRTEDPSVTEISKNSELMNNISPMKSMNITDLELKSMIPNIKLLSSNAIQQNTITPIAENPKNKIPNKIPEIIKSEGNSLENTVSQIGNDTLLELGIIPPNKKSTPFAENPKNEKNMKNESMGTSIFGTPSLVVSKSFDASLEKFDGTLNERMGQSLFEHLAGEA